MLKVGGGATVIGNGVSFYIFGSYAKVDLSGGGAINLSATTTGPLAGILVYVDRAISGGDNAFKGGGDARYEGTIYVPAATVVFAGNATGASVSPYSIFIARRFEFNGQGEFTLNANYSTSAVPTPPGVGPQKSGLVK
jgi:hypothetical protein